MFATLGEFKTALLAYATSDGQSAVKPTDYVFNSSQTAYSNVRVIVAHTEPYAAITPVNLLWFVTNATPDSGKLLRRTVRTPNNGYEHTWEEVTTIEGAFALQEWDYAPPSNLDERDHAHRVGNPHHMNARDVGALPITGGTMEGPLNPRTVVSPATYASTEVVPRSWIETAIEAVVAPVRVLAQQTKALQQNLNSQFINLRNRVVVLESRQGAVRVLVHQIAEPGLATVVVPHNFNRANVLVEVFNASNEKVMPARIKPLDNNSVQIDFAAAFIGRAEVSPKAVF